MLRVFDAVKSDELYDLLVEFIHTLYFRFVSVILFVEYYATDFKLILNFWCRHLLVSPKDRRVVVVESVLCPTTTREVIAKALFIHFEVEWFHIMHIISNVLEVQLKKVLEFNLDFPIGFIFTVCTISCCCFEHSWCQHSTSCRHGSIWNYCYSCIWRCCCVACLAGSATCIPCSWKVFFSILYII